MVYSSYYGAGYTIATILVLASVVFSFWASWKVKHTYKKYTDTRNSRGITGAQAARIVLDKSGLQDVPIARTSGTLTDYYDPSQRQVVLGETEYGNPSAVAVGVACHECGHAIQYAENYWPAKVRMAIVPATNLGSKLSWPLILAGAVFSAVIPVLWNLVYVGIAMFALSVFFQLVTLPTEFDASRRALKCVEEYGLLSGEDYDAAKEVLTAAALTYVAALAVALAQLMRLLVIYGGRNRRR